MFDGSVVLSSSFREIPTFLNIVGSFSELSRIVSEERLFYWHHPNQFGERRHLIEG